MGFRGQQTPFRTSLSIGPGNLLFGLVGERFLRPLKKR